MIFYWENFGAHVLELEDSSEWHLRSEIDDNETARIVLTVGDKTYTICSADYYTTGSILLNSYNVIILYDEVVRTIFDIVKDGNPECIDLVGIQHDILRAGMWDSWKQYGYVTGDFMRGEKCAEKNSVAAERESVEYTR